VEDELVAQRICNAIKAGDCATAQTLIASDPLRQLHATTPTVHTEDSLL